MTHLPVRRIRRDDGWCEDAADRHYNQPVRVPSGSTADRLWRDDRLYDLIIELDHNTRPRIAGRGSAVFIHVARPGFAPTAGCVALKPDALQRLLGRLGPRTRIVVG
jgi:L,D-peptidoglycan transpeptidase YkuD (ErfK/YbiS/YcfS/YnhG family)